MEQNSKHLPVLATSHAINHIYQLLTPAVLPVLTLEFGALNAAIFLWVFTFSYSLLPAVSGYISRWTGRRNLLTGGFVVTALAFLGTTLTSNVLLLAVLFFIAGIGGSTYHPMGSPILADSYPLSKGRTLGLHQTGGAIGSFIAPFIAGLLLSVLGWRPTVGLFAVPGLAIALALWFSINPKSKVTEQDKQGDRIRPADWRIYAPAFVFMAAAFIYVLGQRGMDNVANNYFNLGRGIEIAEASFLFSMLKVAGLFSAPICGRLSDMFGRKAVLIVLVVVESVSLFAITASPVILLFLPCIIFGFASFGLLGVGEALLAEVTPEKERHTMFGINQTLSFSTQLFLIPILFAFAGTGNYNSGLILLSVLMPISIPLLLMIKNKRSKP